LYWWHKAAELHRAGKVKRFGLITTNSLRQTFARRVVQAQLSATPPLSLLFAIPDHPWVDTAEGAAVRIAMTVGAAGEHSGELLEVTGEEPQPDGSEKVSFKSQHGKISADLTTGADVSNQSFLEANAPFCCCPGVSIHRRQVSSSRQRKKTWTRKSSKGLEKIIRPYRNGKDITHDHRAASFAIDLFGLTVDASRDKYPEVYQQVLTRVKPERDAKCPTFGIVKIVVDLRRSHAGISSGAGGFETRYIATTETSKHRFISVFLDAKFCRTTPSSPSRLMMLFILAF
jgi:hypothetical protein